MANETPPTHHSSPTFPLKFELFIDEVEKSAFRSRSILSTILTATFLAALAVYNSLPPEYNWLQSRLYSLERAAQWVAFPDELNVSTFDCPTCPSAIPSDNKLENSFTHLEFVTNFKSLLSWRAGVLDSIAKDSATFPKQIRLKFPDSYFDRNKDQTTSQVNKEENSKCCCPTDYLGKSDLRLVPSRFDTSDFLLAYTTLEGMHFANRQELNGMLQTLGRARVENSLLIRMPILGVSFDVNALLVISAAAFSILFFLLFHSLTRERKNLVLIFKLGDYYEIEDVYLYQLLSMGQVLTVPSSIDEYIRSKEENRIIKPIWYDWLYNRVLRFVTLTPIIIPLILWAVIYFNDQNTRSFGDAINGALTNSNFNISIFLAIPMYLMGIFCIKEWWEMNQTWRKEAKDIKHKLLAGITEDPSKKADQSEG